MTRPSPGLAPAGLDANGDGALALVDALSWGQWVFDWVRWVFFTPGDTALVVLIVEFDEFARAQGLSTQDYGGEFSWAVSLFVWALLAGVGFVLWRGQRRKSG